MCGNFTEIYSFHRISGDSPETLWKLKISAKFHTSKLGEIMMFYIVLNVSLSVALRYNESVMR